MLRAIAASKKKNDRIEAGKIADCSRCDLLSECYMVSTEIRDQVFTSQAQDDSRHCRCDR